MSLEKRMGEINPAAAQVGIYNEESLPKTQQRHKPAAVTGKLQVTFIVNIRSSSFHTSQFSICSTNLILIWFYKDLLQI